MVTLTCPACKSKGWEKEFVVLSKLGVFQYTDDKENTAEYGNILKVHNIQLSFQNNMLYPNNSALQNTKLLILNHVISDVFKHIQKPREDTYNFLQNDITPIIQQMPVDSFILINDVNSFRMGRDEIEKWAHSISNASIIEIGFFEHFEYPNSQFNDTSAKRRTDRDSVFYSNSVCQSAYIVLKKEVTEGKQL
jgi:hypothetical protein